MNIRNEILVNCNLQPTRKSFIGNNADRMGAHPNTVVRHVKIAVELTPEAREILRIAIVTVDIRRARAGALRQWRRAGDIRTHGQLPNVLPATRAGTV